MSNQPISEVDELEQILQRNFGDSKYLNEARTEITAMLHKAEVRGAEGLPKPTEHLCFGCGVALYRVDNRLQCIAPGCGGYQLKAFLNKTGADNPPAPQTNKEK